MAMPAVASPIDAAPRRAQSMLLEQCAAPDRAATALPAKETLQEAELRGLFDSREPARAKAAAA